MGILDSLFRPSQDKFARMLLAEPKRQDDSTGNDFREDK